MTKSTRPRISTDVRLLARRTATAAPDWIERLRADALAGFERHGVPTTRDEEWRETNVAKIANTAFDLAPTAAADRWTAERWQALPLAGLPAARMVVVNGAAVARSIEDGAGGGVHVGSLAAAIRDGDPAVRAHLGQAAASGTRAFTDLNTAFLTDGAYVHVDRETAAERTVHVVHVAEPDRPHVMVHPRTLIVVADGARVRVVETYVGAEGAGSYFSNPVSEIVVGANATVEHVRVQLDADDAWHLGEVAVRQGRDSDVRSTHFALGARLARVDACARLEGEGGHHALDGLYVVDGDDHVDHHTTLDHAVAHCTSHELFKGILGGRARAVFKGRIIVRQDAQKTDAVQHNPNLLLSDDALIHTRPQLEIYADDVRCTHGATVGQIDADQLFYLRSRGIDPDAGRDLLIHAFARDVLDRVGVEGLRDLLEREIDARLPSA